MAAAERLKGAVRKIEPTKYHPIGTRVKLHSPSAIEWRGVVTIVIDDRGVKDGSNEGISASFYHWMAVDDQTPNPEHEPYVRAGREKLQKRLDAHQRAANLRKRRAEEGYTGHGSYWTPRRKRELLAVFSQNNFSLEATSEHYGVSVQTIEPLVRRAIQAPRGHRMAQPPIETIEQAIEANLEGLATIRAVGGPHEGVLAAQYVVRLRAAAQAVQRLFEDNATR
jgi:hypothetical protein